MKIKLDKKIILCLFFLGVAFCFAANPAFAADTNGTNNVTNITKSPDLNIENTNNTNVIYVSTDGNNSNTGLTPNTALKTIQNGINTVTEGGKVDVMPGTYYENLNINRNITLSGSNPETTIIDGQQTATVINIKAGNSVTISGLTIEKGQATIGAGINNQGNLTLENCILSDNIAQPPPFHNYYLSDQAKGGGIYNNGGVLTVTNCTFNHNQANSARKDYNGLDKMTFYYSGDGGAIYNNCGTLTISNSSFINNTAGYDAGGIYNSNGNLTIANTNFTGNKITSYLLYQTNYEYSTGGVGVNYGYLNGVSILGQDGLYGGIGGAIYSQGTNNLIVTSCEFNKNNAIYGAGIYYNGTKTFNVTDTTFNDNNATAYDSNGNPLTVTLMTFPDTGENWLNIVKDIFAVPLKIAGGAFGMINDYVSDKGISKDVGSTLSDIVGLVTGSSLNSTSGVETTTTTFEGTGSAICIKNGNATLSGCTFNNNTAQLGGGIYDSSTGKSIVTGSIFSDNTANDGGAIYDMFSSILSVNGCSFNRNGAIDGGGAIMYNGISGQNWGLINITENIFDYNVAYLGSAVYVGINGTSRTYINYNSIYGIDQYDIYDPYAANNNVGADARYNWWGSNDPSPFTNNNPWIIVISPYMVLKVTDNPSYPYIISPVDVQYGKSVIISASLLYANSGENPYKPAVYGVVPANGTIVTFDILQNGGSLTSLTAPIIDGTATTIYTANKNINPELPVIIGAAADQVQNGTVFTYFNVKNAPSETIGLGSTGSNGNSTGSNGSTASTVRPVSSTGTSNGSIARFVPMQNTGVPLLPGITGVLAVLSGLTLSRRKLKP